MKLILPKFVVPVLIFFITQQTFCAEIPLSVFTNETISTSTSTTPKSDTNETLVTKTILGEHTLEVQNITEINKSNETYTTYVSDTPSLKDIEELSKQFVDKQNKTDSEVNDLNKTDLDLELAKTILTNTTFEKHEDVISVVKDSNDVGPIQSNENEDDREAKKAFLEQLEKDQEIILDAGPLVKAPANNGGSAGQIPVIIASIFVILCMIGYTAMLMWRRHLERKYGNREMLVNEEFDPNDLRHFSI